jgi:glycosyltransferase involved in cell wall biosynthesis
MENTEQTKHRLISGYEVQMELTILMPCLNEAQTLEICISRAKQLLTNNNLDGEILIADNGSTDGSQEIARRCGARVVDCSIKGYGATLQSGLEHARGKYFLVGDSDGSYHFDEAFPMIEKLREGFDVCIGTRRKDTIKPGAMSYFNKYFGNPVLTCIGQLLFNVKVSGFHCGMRAFKRKFVADLNLQAIGKEWAPEHTIKSSFAGAKIAEVPIVLYGWKHLRIMLLHAPPTRLFIVPSLALILAGVVFGGLLLEGPVKIGKAILDVRTLVLMYCVIILGTQALFTGIFVSIYGHLMGFLPMSQRYFNAVKFFSFGKLIFLALALGICGLTILGYHYLEWLDGGSPPLNSGVMMRKIIPALTMVTISGQCILNVFMLSMLFMGPKGKPNIFYEWEEHLGVKSRSN